MEWWSIVVTVAFFVFAGYGLYLVIRFLTQNPRGVIPKVALKLELERFHRILPQPPTAVAGTYRVPSKFKEEIRKTKLSSGSLQKVADNICYFLGLLRSPKIYVSESKPFHEESLFEPSESLGLYRTQLGYQYEVSLVKKLGMKQKHILAILAHECTHHYLITRNIRDEDRAKNEVLTDVAGCYLGLGGLLLKGYGRISGVGRKFSGYTFGISIGYANRIDLLRSISISAKLRYNKDIAAPLPFYRRLLVNLYLDRIRRGRPSGRPG